MRPSLLALLLLAVTACGPAASTKPPKPSETTGTCSALPGTKLCQDAAKSLLALAAGDRRPTAPNGCQWVVSELAMPSDEYLLYLSAKCGGPNGKITTLDYAGGAHKAELSYASSAIAGDALKGHKIIEIHSLDDKDPHAAILSAAREVITNRAEAAKCRVVPATGMGFPADALVVDVPAADAAKAPKDEPRTACGPYGLDQDSQTYWRVFQGYSWFFDLGQEELEFDPGSLTLVHKDNQSNWVRL